MPGIWRLTVGGRFEILGPTFRHRADGPERSAVGSGTFLPPLFAGIYRMGAGLGPA
ncbi:MAG: hypothetical protein K0A99_02380 [Desulfoarculaceae bacterium]|nr:hypothetical protein [Desulfoarculaceae bacterium]